MNKGCLIFIILIGIVIGVFAVKFHGKSVTYVILEKSKNNLYSILTKDHTADEVAGFKKTYEKFLQDLMTQGKNITVEYSHLIRMITEMTGDRKLSKRETSKWIKEYNSVTLN